MVERLLKKSSRHSGQYETTTADWAALDSGRTASDVSLARLAAANVHYGAFGELLEGPPPRPQLRDSTSHYGPYGELVERSCPLLVGSKDEENVKSGGAERDNGDAGHLSSDDGSESEGEDDAGEEGEDDAPSDTKICQICRIP